MTAFDWLCVYDGFCKLELDLSCSFYAFFLRLKGIFRKTMANKLNRKLYGKLKIVINFIVILVFVNISENCDVARGAVSGWIYFVTWIIICIRIDKASIVLICVKSILASIVVLSEVKFWLPSLFLLQ